MDFPYIPATSAKPNTKANAVQYDNNYTQNTAAAFIGIIFFVVPILFIIFSLLTYALDDGLKEFIVTLIGGALVTRLISIVWVVKLANEQNRNKYFWAILAVMLPGSTLFMIGNTNKIIYSK